MKLVFTHYPKYIEIILKTSKMNLLLYKTYNKISFNWDMLDWKQ